MTGQQYKRRQKLFREILGDVLRDVYRMMDYKDMPAREVHSHLSLEDQEYWGSRSISRKLRRMNDVKVVGKDKGANVYRLVK